ncbi:unnamed protein product [Adineta steineri]|uniref:Zinc-binding loop region of homing endonuclease domain-containing protein n=1 Tax=Adineta steineri TaxID=433720 RepID=A0A818GY88_9BILA|nr:unnamed protein product [Adineta steineri]CAF3914477.1 unnamed protein product [Adineta steineri]CAF4113136.1 unnamed protein product [Adineta steineri]
MKPENLINSSKDYLRLRTRQCAQWSSLSRDLYEYCKSNNIGYINVVVHPVILREKEKNKLPLLSTYNGGSQGSHLCDTPSCVSEKHLRVETKEINISRKNRFGIILQVHRRDDGINTVTNTMSCDHGEDEEKTMDEQLDNSCRKICVTIVRDHNVHK